MTMIKRLGVFLALLMFIGTAYARVDIHQNDDGSANWEGSSGNEAGIGTYLTVHMTNIGTATTSYALVPFDGVIARFRAIVQKGHFGGTAIIRVAHATDNVDPAFWLIVEGTSGTITVAGGAVEAEGYRYDSGVITGNNTVDEGQVISVFSDGGGTDAAGELDIIIDFRLR